MFGYTMNVIGAVLTNLEENYQNEVIFIFNNYKKLKNAKLQMLMKER